MWLSRFLPAAVLAALVSTVFADQRGDTPDTRPSTPQEQLAKFHVPPGFEVQLVAAEPDIQKPINLNFDAAGRLWVSGSTMYPWPASTDVNGAPIPDFDKGWQGIIDGFRVGDAPAPSAEARDTVRILGDFAPDGRARKITTFADRLNIPSGVQPLPRKAAGWSSSTAAAKGDTAIVYSIPHIWLLTDMDGDGSAEKREPLYTGFGYTDTHGGASSFIYWIDGWIYGTHGFRNHSEVRDRGGRVTTLDSGNTYRFRPDGSAFEIFAHGQTNPFGLAFDPLGNLFSADSHSKPVMMLLRGGYYQGIGKQHDGLGFAPTITDDDHGSSAIAGITVLADDRWPAEYRGNLLNGNPVTRRLNRDRLEWHGSTPRAIRMPDFLTCDDPWFRPVNLKLGPDGALYIADFYTPIIGHYEVPLTHPQRDHTHGRIWRVVWRGENASAQRAEAAPGSTRVSRVGEGVPPSRTSESERKPGAASATDAPAEVRRGETPRPTRETRVLPGTPDLTQLDAYALIKKLTDPNLEVQRLATNELVCRGMVTNVPDRHLPRETLEIEAALGARLEAGAKPSIFTVAMYERMMGGPSERLAASDGGIFNTVTSSNPVIASFAVRFFADRAGDESFLGSMAMLAAKKSEPNSMVRRAAVETISRSPSFHALEGLLALHPEISSSDVMLRYAWRLAVKAVLSSPNGFWEARQLSRNSLSTETILADVGMAIPSTEAAEFLLSHLLRTNSTRSNAPDHLRHAAIFLDANSLKRIVAVIDPSEAFTPPQKLAMASSLVSAARSRTGPGSLDVFVSWAQDVILSGLASPDAVMARRAIEAVRDETFPAKLEALAAIARDETRDAPLRLAALDAAANLPGSRDLFRGIFADAKTMSLRKRAAELLAQNGDTATVLAALPQAPWELTVAIAAGLGRTGAGATALLDAIEAGKAPARVLVNKAVVAGFFPRPTPLQDRAKVLAKDLPPEDARLDKVIAERAAAFRTAQPNAYNGSALFQKHCAVCHRYRNVSQGSVGPNLDGMAARGAERLIEDILDPNRNLDPAFRQTVVATADGQTLVGANPRESADLLTLTDPAGKDLSIPKSKIKSRTTLPQSLMPSGFETTLSPAELHDLVHYLISGAG